VDALQTATGGGGFNSVTWGAGAIFALFTN
jgi:hypothetical protein